MRPSWGKKMMLGVSLATLFAASTTVAQTGSTDESKRKVKIRVAPTYPELARKMSVAGKVKIEVVVSPDGHVKSAKVVGGHPLLVQACSDAVKEWKFTPASEESTQTVEFEFRGSGN